MRRRVTLVDAVIVITELLDMAFAASIRRSVAARRGKRSKVAERDLRLLVDEIIPDVMIEHEGIDGDLVWWIACRQILRRRGAIEERALIDDPGAREVFEDGQAWRGFRALLTTSPAGLTWGHLESRLRRWWS